MKAFYRQVADNRGSSPDTWWHAGRRLVDKYGVNYELDRIDRQDEDSAKVFFRRLNADGTPRGMSVPIHLIREEDEWRVSVASY